MTAISEALAEKIERIHSGFAALEKLDVPPDVSLQIQAEFAKSFDLAAAIAAKDRILAEKKQLLEFANHLTAQNAARAAQDDRDEITQPTEEKPAEAQEAGAGVETDECSMQLDFRVWVTRPQMMALREFLKSNNIKYGKVPRK